SLTASPTAAAAGRLEHVLVADGAVRGVTAAHHLALRARAAPGVVQVLSTEDGAFALRGLAPGRWEVGASVDGAFVPQAAVDIVAGAAVWVDLRAATAVTVRGSVRIRGAPAAGLEVRAGVDAANVLARTGDDGGFELRAGATALAGQLVFAHRGVAIGSRTLGDVVGRGGELGLLDLAARRTAARAVDEAGRP